MSRSHRKTSVAAITMAASDKEFKKLEHRRARRALSAIDLMENEPPAEKLFGDNWKSCKDGKAYFNAQKHPKLMRK